MVADLTIPELWAGFILGALVVLVIVIALAFKFGIMQFHTGDRRHYR